MSLKSIAERLAEELAKTGKKLDRTVLHLAEAVDNIVGSIPKGQLTEKGFDSLPPTARKAMVDGLLKVTDAAPTPGAKKAIAQEYLNTFRIKFGEGKAGDDAFDKFGKQFAKALDEEMKGGAKPDLIRQAGGPVTNPRAPTPASTEKPPIINVDARRKPGTKDMGDAQHVEPTFEEPVATGGGAGRKEPPKAPSSPTPPTPPTGEDRLAFAAALQKNRWGTEISPQSFKAFEDALKRDGKLYSGVNIEADLGRKQFNKIDDIVKAARNDQPISLEELVLLRDRGGMGALGKPKFPSAANPYTTNSGTSGTFDAAKFLTGAKGWFSALTPSLSGLTFRTVESVRWNGIRSLETFGRALATTALGYGIMGYTPDKFTEFSNADLSKLSVESDRGWGIVAKRLDDLNILSDTLEKHIGNNETHWISDQEYDKLIKGKSFNDAFVARIEAITGAKLSDPKYQTKSGDPDTWRNMYDVGLKLQANQNTFNSQIMVAVNAAFSRNIGMNTDAGSGSTSTKDGAGVSTITTSDPKVALDFIADRYVGAVAQKLGSDPKYRKEFLAKYYGPTVDTSDTLSMVSGLGNVSNTPGAFALDRKAIARFLATTNSSIGEEKDLLDDTKRQEVMINLNKALVAKNNQAAINSSGPVPMLDIGGVLTGATAQNQPLSQSQYQLDGETFDNRLKGISYSNPGLYNALADVFKRVTHKDVKPEQELSAANVMTREESIVFAEEAKTMLSAQKIDPERAEKMVKMLTEPVSGIPAYSR